MYALFLLWHPVYATKCNTHVYNEFSFGGYVFYIFALSVLYNGEFEHDFHSHDCNRKRVHPIKLLFSQTFILLDGYYNVSMVQKKGHFDRWNIHVIILMM